MFSCEFANPTRWRPRDQQKALALPQPPPARSLPSKETFTAEPAFISQPGDLPGVGSEQCLGCPVPHTTAAPWGAPGDAAPGVLLGMQPLDAPWGCSLPSLQLTRTAQRGQWQHGGGSQMCEWASVAQGKSQHRPCGQNPGIWVSPRHHSEGSGQGKQPGWLPTAPGEWDGGTEDGQCQHRPCCPAPGLSMPPPFPSCRPFRHHLVHP